MVGPTDLIGQLDGVQYATHNHTTPVLQETMALSLLRAREGYQGFGDYYGYLADKFWRNSQVLTRAIEDAGDLKMKTVAPDGGYFLLADISESVDQMPVKYLYSAEKWESMGERQNLKLDTFQEYQNFESNTCFIIKSSDICLNREIL